MSGQPSYAQVHGIRVASYLTLPPNPQASQ